MLCSFLSICGRAKKTISNKKKMQMHAHDFDPDDPDLALDLSEDVLRAQWQVVHQVKLMKMMNLK